MINATKRNVQDSKNTICKRTNVIFLIFNKKNLSDTVNWLRRSFDLVECSCSRATCRLLWSCVQRIMLKSVEPIAYKILAKNMLTGAESHTLRQVGNLD